MVAGSLQVAILSIYELRRNKFTLSLFSYFLSNVTRLPSAVASFFLLLHHHAIGLAMSPSCLLSCRLEKGTFSSLPLLEVFFKFVLTNLLKCFIYFTNRS